MCFSAAYSYCEVAFSYIIGVVMGTFWFKVGLGNIEAFSLNGLALLAGMIIVATLWASILDRMAIHWANSFFKSMCLSILIAPAKLPFSPMTTLIGFCFWLKGVSTIKVNGKVGFKNGVLWSEYQPAGPGHAALTLGATIVSFRGGTPFAHELYHTRQYIYLSDLLIPFWLLGCIWGWISAWLSPSHRANITLMMGADSRTEVGNPLEITAHRLWSF